MPNGVRSRGNSRVANQNRNRIEAQVVSAIPVDTTLVVAAVEMDNSDLESRIRCLENQIKGMKKQNKVSHKKISDELDVKMKSIDYMCKKLLILKKCGIVHFKTTDKAGHAAIDITIPIFPQYKGEDITDKDINGLIKLERLTHSLSNRMTDMKFDWTNGKCSLCGCPLDCSHGHNAQPIFPSDRKRVCKYCNDAVVIPERIEIAKNGTNWRDQLNPAKMTEADKISILSSIINRK